MTVAALETATSLTSRSKSCTQTPTPPENDGMESGNEVFQQRQLAGSCCSHLSDKVSIFCSEEGGLVCRRLSSGSRSRTSYVILVLQVL